MADVPGVVSLNLRPWITTASRVVPNGSHGPQNHGRLRAAAGMAAGTGILGSGRWRRRRVAMAAQVQTDSADVKSEESVSEVKESGDQRDQRDQRNQDEDGEAAFLSDTKALDTQILSLALPALIALSAEPVLSIIDTGFVGRLPNAPLCLGGLGFLVASSFLSVVNRIYLNHLEYTDG